MSIDQHPFGNLHGCHPKRGIRLGWALQLPVLVQMNQLSEHHRPKSHDSGFRVVWSGQDFDGESVERKVDWKAITDDWQQVNAPAQEQDSEKDNE